MDHVVSDFHSLVVDGSTPQILVLCEGDANATPNGNFYLSTDGDMSTDGVTFVDEMTSADNYMVGCVPSRTMSVSLMNVEGYLNGHNFHWLNAYIGVQYNEYTPSLPEGTYAETVYQGREQSWSGTYSCRTNGFYKDDTRIRSGNCTGAFTMDDGLWYFFINTDGSVLAYQYNCDTGTNKRVSSISGAMRDKFSNGKIVTFEAYTSNQTIITICEDGVDKTYYLAHMGNFRVDKPKKTLGKTIDITDAFDAAHELDVDASPVLTSSNAQDADRLMNDIAYYCDLSLDYFTTSIGNRFLNLAVDLKDLRNNSYSCRRLVSFMCEAVGCNARVTPGTNKLFIYTPASQAGAKSYKITAGRVEANTFETQEEETGGIDCVSVKSLENETILYPPRGGQYVYEFDGNPFVTSPTLTLYQRIATIPSYTPMSFSLIEADPSFQAGDLIRVYLTYGTYEELETYNHITITTHDEQEITVKSAFGNYTVPLISQTIHWNGKTSAVYDIKGSADRSDSSADNYTDTNARTSKYISADYISAGTLTGVTINNGSGTFYVDAEGNLTATNADLSGEINATSGSISGDLALTGSLSMNGVTINNSGIHANNNFGDETAIEAQGMVFYNTLGGLRTRIGWIQGGQSNVEIHGEEYLYIDADTVLGIDSPDIRVNGHSSSVGTIVSNSLSASVAVTADSNTPLCEVTLTTGLWLVFGYVKWAGVSSAVKRYINISGTSGATNARIRTDAYTEPNTQFQMECSGYLNVTSASSTYYLNANTSVAGNALATYTQLNAVRLL